MGQIITDEGAQRGKIAQIAEDWGRGKKVDLVFEGGGVLGIGLVGAYSALESRGYLPQNLAGTSAGAIVATLIAAGYTATEIRDIILDELDLTRITDPVRELRIPLLGPSWIGRGLALLRNHGLYKGDFFLEYMREKLCAKGVRTFGDLVYDANPGSELLYRHKVQVIVSDLTGRSLLHLPMDAQAAFGIAPDDLPVAEAVRMSMSIPLFFKPVQQRNEQRGETHILVDGGMLSNFPIRLFDTPGLPDWPTFGVKLVGPERRDDFAERLPIPLRGDPARFAGLLQAMVSTMVQAHDRLALDDDAFARTICIPTYGLGGTNFALTVREKQQLFDSGDAAAASFLDQSWSYREYLTTFRSGQPPTRRQIITEHMQRQ